MTTLELTPGERVMIDTPFGQLRATIVHKISWRCTDCGAEVWHCQVTENAEDVAVCFPAIRRAN